MLNSKKIDSNLRKKITSVFFKLIEEEDQDLNFLFNFENIDNGWVFKAYENTVSYYETEYKIFFDLEGNLNNNNDFNFILQKSFLNNNNVHFYVKKRKFNNDLSLKKEGFFLENRIYSLNKFSSEKNIIEKNILANMKDYIKYSFNALKESNNVDLKINLINNNANVFEINSCYIEEKLILTKIKKNNSFNIFKYINDNEFNLDIPVLHENKEYFCSISSVPSNGRSYNDLNIYYHSPKDVKNLNPITYNLLLNAEQVVGNDYICFTKNLNKNNLSLFIISHQDISTEEELTYCIHYSFYKKSLCIDTIYTPKVSSDFLIDMSIPFNLYDIFEKNIIKELVTRSNVSNNNDYIDLKTLKKLKHLSNIFNQEFNTNKLSNLKLNNIDDIVNFSEGFDIVNKMSKNNLNIKNTLNFKK